VALPIKFTWSYQSVQQLPRLALVALETFVVLQFLAIFPLPLLSPLKIGQSDGRLGAEALPMFTPDARNRP